MIVGGLRARFVKESLFNMVVDSLTALGWFDSGRDHMPLLPRTTGVPDKEEVEFNTIAFADAGLDSLDEEMGSRLSEHRWSFFIDIFAEDVALGIHLSQDIKCILEGRMPSIGRGSNWLDIINYAATSATPIVIASAEINDVMVDRADGFPQPFRRNWYSVAVTISDYWGTDADE